MGSVGGIKQGFGARGNLAFAVQQQVTNLLAKLGSARLEGSNHGSPKRRQVGLDEVRLS
jgi:hypothetical protein